MNPPSISLLTPSFNKAAFIEAALQSILNQNYPTLEYGVVDGASTDGTLEILKSYEDRLAFLISEPDDGMYDALCKGFSRTTGEIMGYLGADDMHMPWTLSVVGEIFQAFPQVEWITSAFPMTADRHGRVIRTRYIGPFSKKAFFAGRYLPGFSWHSDGWIQQESTFWRRSLWERSGGLDPSLRLAGDFDLWCRFMKRAELYAVATPLAAFRRHGDQISDQQANDYKSEAFNALTRHGGKASTYLASGMSKLFSCFASTSNGQIKYDHLKNAWRLF